MLRRSTIGKTGPSLKQRQLSHLHSQLAQLEAHIADFEGLMKITTHQALHVKQLGIMHGSLLMSAHKIFEEEVRAQDNEETSEEESTEKESEA